MYLQSFPHRHSHLKRILTGNRCSFGYRFQKQSALGGCSRSKYQYVNAINHRLFTICLISSGSISAGNIHTEVHILIRVLKYHPNTKPKPRSETPSIDISEFFSCYTLLLSTCLHITFYCRHFPAIDTNLHNGLHIMSVNHQINEVARNRSQLNRCAIE